MFMMIKFFVSAIPSGPFISPTPPVYVSSGDHINLNCSVFGSRPHPTLNWYINKTPVTAREFTYTEEAVSIIHTNEQEDGRLDCVLQLKFRIREKHFQVIIGS